MSSAQEIAEHAANVAREAGASNVVVFVSVPPAKGDTNSTYFAKWVGDIVALRGLVSLGLKTLLKGCK